MMLGEEKRGEFGETAIEYLKSTFNDELETVESYVSEGEHQDGYGYWDQFSTLAEVEADFRLYMESVG